MATRDDVLRELGLGPRWRLRPRAVVSTHEVATRGDVALAERPAESRTQPAITQPAALETDPRVIRIATLEFPALVTDIAGCTACGLSRTRHKTVPGVGDVDADWMFIGEAPGAEEDAQGEP